jgi:hypothetical protein
MRDRVAIGQVWRRRHDGQLARVRQVHRPDRLCELEITEPAPSARMVLPVSFTELRTKWQPATQTTNEGSRDGPRLIAIRDWTCSAAAPTAARIAIFTKVPSRHPTTTRSR